MWVLFVLFLFLIGLLLFGYGIGVWFGEDQRIFFHKGRGLKKIGLQILVTTPDYW
jgi:hypothetical protein